MLAWVSMKRWMPGLLLLAGCGGGWADADTTAVTGAARAQLMIETLCAEGEDCKPAQVRALERLAFCSNAMIALILSQPRVKAPAMLSHRVTKKSRSGSQ